MDALNPRCERCRVQQQSMTPISTLTVTPFGPTHARNRQRQTTDHFRLPTRRVFALLPRSSACAWTRWNIGSPPNGTTIGQSVLARLRHSLVAGGLSPSSKTRPWLVRFSLGHETDADATPAFPQPALRKYKCVGRRHKPAFPTPDVQRNTSSGPWGACLLVVSRGCTRGNVWWSPIRNFQEEAVG